MEPMQLACATPLFSGSEKAVYQHPHNPAWLVKVMRDSKPTSWQARWLRLPRYWPFLSEWREFVVVRERRAEGCGFLQRFIGPVDTDLGLGMVVEAVRAADGDFAPTLGRMYRTGQLKPAHIDALQKVIDWMLECNLVVSDISTNNFVWDDAHGRWVLIDGIGSREPLSLRYWWSAYNRRMTRKKTHKLLGKVANLAPATEATKA
ncbi:PhoP regulatory network YrbL family protein [Simiduia sp. 21SJ11W-1]|uniref:YrbL family protein n=1 Tax=Simiduia sp. 21SJ11W-1 TaxID=2909669 RepID=UPI0020A169EC|nr:YrbL family protein [Simiduia sp. 21SJ11W-1]UTA48002.1 PhoP regulatory network YrbL family protein [Simiduia sp. 21SJ11W-1]